MRKLRLKGHITAYKWQRWNVKPGLLNSKVRAMKYCAILFCNTAKVGNKVETRHGGLGLGSHGLSGHPIRALSGLYSTV